MVNILTQKIFSFWLQFHFFDIPSRILDGWKNFLKFNLNYFSLPLLLKTFFAPWRKYKMNYGKRFDLWLYFQAFVFNSFSRIVGAILRLFILFLGFILEIIIFFAGLIIFFFWIFLPLFLAIILFFGLKMIL